MESGITIDFTKKQNLVKHIENQTTKIRNKINQARQQKITSIFYQAKFPKLKIVYLEQGGKIYDSQNAAKNGQYKKSAWMEQSGTVKVEMSTNNIYPFRIGFVKTGAPNKPDIEQACEVIVNGKALILTGIVYPPVLPEDNSLVHWLGILVAEQIRFNTIAIYQKPGEHDDAFALYKAMFMNFKIKNNIYNDWTGVWEQKPVTIFGKDGKEICQSVVKKLLSKK